MRQVRQSWRHCRMHGGHVCPDLPRGAQFLFQGATSVPACVPTSFFQKSARPWPDILNHLKCPRRLSDLHKRLFSGENHAVSNLYVTTPILHSIARKASYFCWRIFNSFESWEKLTRVNISRTLSTLSKESKSFFGDVLYWIITTQDTPTYIECIVQIESDHSWELYDCFIAQIPFLQ